MDNFPDGVSPDLLVPLSYDDNIAYEEQLPTHSDNDAASLANRIGTSKVYLLAETSVATGRIGKRKHAEEEEEEDVTMEEDDSIGEDTTYRANALLFQGSPIAHLPTTRIFAYATHFDTHPMGLEWVDDTTCILVFETKASARLAYRYLLKSASEEPDFEGCITAKSIPIALWPPEERINKSLGKGEGLKGVIRMRWARTEDVKKKGAKNQSQFYKKHGTAGGKELFNGRDLPPPKRRRREDGGVDEELERAQLDDELDAFLAADDDEVVEEVVEPARDPSPPSKMRSDYIADDGRTLLERTSVLRMHSDNTPDLASRITARLPRRARGALAMDSVGDRIESTEKLEWGPSLEHSRRGGRRRDNPRRSGRPKTERNGGRTERPRKTQEELDAELDAFLNEP